MSGKDLVKHHEDANHFGGYFIINGNEKVMRMLQVRWLIGILVKTELDLFANRMFDCSTGHDLIGHDGQFTMETGIFVSVLYPSLENIGKTLVLILLDKIVSRNLHPANLSIPGASSQPHLRH